MTSNPLTRGVAKFTIFADRGKVIEVVSGQKIMNVVSGSPFLALSLPSIVLSQNEMVLSVVQRVRGVRRGSLSILR